MSTPYPSNSPSSSVLSVSSSVRPVPSRYSSGSRMSSTTRSEVALEPVQLRLNRVVPVFAFRVVVGDHDVRVRGVHPVPVDLAFAVGDREVGERAVIARSEGPNVDVGPRSTSPVRESRRRRASIRSPASSSRASLAIVVTGPYAAWWFKCHRAIISDESPTAGIRPLRSYGTTAKYRVRNAA